MKECDYVQSWGEWRSPEPDNQFTYYARHKDGRIDHVSEEMACVIEERVKLKKEIRKIEEEKLELERRRT